MSSHELISAEQFVYDEDAFSILHGLKMSAGAHFYSAKLMQWSDNSYRSRRVTHEHQRRLSFRQITVVRIDAGLDDFARTFE